MKRMLMLTAFLFAPLLQAAPPALNFGVVDQTCTQWQLSLATLTCPGGTPPPPVIDCGVPTKVMSVFVLPAPRTASTNPWSKGTVNRWYTDVAGIFPPNGKDVRAGDAVVVPFTASMDQTTVYQINVTEISPAPTVNRRYVVSTEPCGEGSVVTDFSSIKLSFKASSWNNGNVQYHLTPGAQYYLTVFATSASPAVQNFYVSSAQN